MKLLLRSHVPRSFSSPALFAAVVLGVTISSSFAAADTNKTTTAAAPVKGSKGFYHPGVLVNRAQLEFIRAATVSPAVTFDDDGVIVSDKKVLDAAEASWGMANTAVINNNRVAPVPEVLIGRFMVLFVERENQGRATPQLPPVRLNCLLSFRSTTAF